MKQRIQGMVFGCILTVVLLGAVTVMANTGERNITVMFRNIRLVVDGQLVTPRDGAGNVVEPFIWEGTTYLPVRAVADALGSDVHWDAATSTVYLNSRAAFVPPPPVFVPEPVPVPLPTPEPAPVAYSWLDHMPHLSYQRGGTFRTSLSAWTPGRQSSDGTAFDRGILFYKTWTGGGATGWQSIDIALNGNYNNFTGMLASSDTRRGGTTQVTIYGDGQMLYTSPMLSRGTIPVPFNINVSGVTLLNIRVETNGDIGHGLGIVNARFER